MPGIGSTGTRTWPPVSACLPVAGSVRAGSACTGRRAACSWLFLLADWLQEDQVVPHVLFRADHACLSWTEQGEVALPGVLLHLEFAPATVGQVKHIALAVPGHAAKED